MFGWKLFRLIELGVLTELNADKLCTHTVQFYASLQVHTANSQVSTHPLKPYAKPGTKKKRFHQPAAAAKNLLHLTAAINPTKRVKRRPASRRNTQRKCPFLTSRMRDFAGILLDWFYRTTEKEIKHDKNLRKTQSHLLFVRRRRLSSLVAA
jgi:hypothetical protein